MLFDIICYTALFYMYYREFKLYLNNQIKRFFFPIAALYFSFLSQALLTFLHCNSCAILFFCPQINPLILSSTMDITKSRWPSALWIYHRNYAAEYFLLFCRLDNSDIKFPGASPQLNAIHTYRFESFFV